jgi:hypothetical protein
MFVCVGKKGTSVPILEGGQVSYGELSIFWNMVFLYTHTHTHTHMNYDYH